LGAVAIEHHRISHSQLAECLGYEPSQFIGVQMVCGRDYTGWVVVSEGVEMQTTGTFPQAHDNTKRKPKGKGKK
jgi:hypothetical protein